MPWPIPESKRILVIFINKFVVLVLRIAIVIIVIVLSTTGYLGMM